MSDEQRSTVAESPRGAAEVTASINERFLERLSELLDGMPAGQPTWVTNGGPEGGINGSIADLSAEQASREVAGTTIAAHVEHERWALRLANDYFSGKEPTASWSESWTVKAVDEAAWHQLRSDLAAEGRQLLANVAGSHDWREPDAQNGAFATYGHLAYHLGAIRQLRKLVI